MSGQEPLDKRIIELLSKRCDQYIDEMKARGGDPASLYSPPARASLFKRIEEGLAPPLTGEFIRRVYNELLTLAIDAVKPQRVAYLGPEGTFSHSALLEIFGESVKAEAMKTIHDVFTEVEMGRASFGVVPIENSTEGAVTYTLDELLDTELKIISEKYLRISYSLLSVSDDIKKIKKLYSHPQPLAQCKEWIRTNLPDAEIHHLGSTSLAAEAASWDKLSAAIASEAAARIYKLNVLTSNIEDSRQNYTRFFVIGNTENPPSGKDKTSVICAIKDKPGALYNLLRPLTEAGINMTRIESRPDKKKMWEYNFFIDFIGHTDSTVVKIVIERMKEELIFLKVLGSYPAEN